MWNSSDRRRRPGGAKGVPVSVAFCGLALVLLSSAVVAGLEQDGQAPQQPGATASVPTPTVVPAPPDAPVPAAQANPDKAPAAQSAYQLRCWQYGRLLFDERNLESPSPAGRYALAMRAEGGATLQVVDLGSATCLIQRRSVAAADRR